MKRMPRLASKQTCTGCMMCVDICPQNAISPQMAFDGFRYPKINKTLCIKCGHCERTCPITSNFSYNREDDVSPRPFTAWHTDMNVRMDSSSGGVFSALAETILAKGGVVIGAAIDGLNVRHIAIEKLEDLPKLRRSKYQQSETEGIYKKTLECLKVGKPVLFTGTPCHIGALYAFLARATYSGVLYTMDIFCHGVPSNLVLSKWAKVKKAKQILHYRDKRDMGWRTRECAGFDALDDKANHLAPTPHGDFVSNAFLSWLTLRRSCADCKFAHLKRKADFTVADFWGERNHPKEHDAGLSLVIAQNMRAIHFLKQCKGLYLEPVLWRETCVGVNRRLHDGTEALCAHWLRKIMPIAFHSFPLALLANLYTSKVGLKSYQEARRKDYKHGITSMQTAFFKEIPTINLMAFQSHLNYGSCLNVYALKETLEHFGYNCRLLDAPLAGYREKFFPGNHGSYEKLSEKFNSFRAIHMRYEYNLDELKAKEFFSENDAFIVGSDQIWNPKCCAERRNDFLLSFLPTTYTSSPKIAYAVSFGGARESILHAPQIKAEMSPLIKQFDAISCREDDGVQLCKETFGVDAQWCIDPTFLLKKEDYAKLFNHLIPEEPPHARISLLSLLRH